MTVASDVSRLTINPQRTFDWGEERSPMRVIEARIQKMQSPAPARQTFAADKTPDSLTEQNADGSDLCHHPRLLATPLLGECSIGSNRSIRDDQVSEHLVVGSRH